MSHETTAQILASVLLVVVALGLPGAVAFGMAIGREQARGRRRA